VSVTVRLAVCSGVALCAAALASPAMGAIVHRGTSTTTYASDSTKSLAATVPGAAQPGDLLIASLGFGKNGAKSQPSLSAPAGWTLVSRTNQGRVGSLAVYRHVLLAGETSFTWTTNVTVGGTVFLAAFTGVDVTAPVDAWAGRSVSRPGTSVATPSVTTTVASDVLVASYFAYNGKGIPTSWSPPAGMAELGDAANTSGSRSGSVDYAVKESAGATGTKTATASAGQDYALAALVALRPGPVSGQDVVPPVIGAVQAGSVGSGGATVSWATDEPADGQVEYGLTSAYGASTALDPSLVTGHAAVISGLVPDTVYHYRVKSRDAAGNLATSSDSTFRTAAAAPAGPVPLIVDTDIFSDADDVGALATAFALQLKGEAKVVALGVNTRTSRPSVATNSWKCAAAVAQFYGAGDTPIGTDTPNDGTATNTLDFIGPCSLLASPSTPIPDTAVRVFRRALAAQADGSVVVVEAGYSENLSALLNSPADSISPLSGRDLVALKVKSLVIMAGGYPSRSGENNLIGNPAAAQDVAANWPTKIVWSGYEVGDAIHTGDTISRTHPTTSPVRVSYEAFVGPNKWIYSYDLTAVYHAVRPSDTLLTEVGPGTNSVTSSGGNTFTLGSGNQYYLRLGDATSLDASIEALLDTLPAQAPPDSTPPVIGGVSVGSVSSAGATVLWSTNEASDSQVEYGPTSAYGSSTSLDPGLVLTHATVLSGLSPGTTYHYRVKSRDAAGNLATSVDLTFETLSVGPAVGPSDTFDGNVVDPAKWIVTEDGSTVSAANQQLEIAHAAGAWTKGTIQSATAHDQRGKALQVQVKRAANSGLGGSTFGETSIYLWIDATHSVSFFIAGGSLTAWVDNGPSEVNLTPGWPAYNATAMQWLRFREAGGTLYWEYASGTAAPGSWTQLAAIADPFPLDAVTLKIVAGSNLTKADVAAFDNVDTY
jgi:hypothetical protein